MGTNEIIRRRALQSGGSAIDWESIARGMLDVTTAFEVPIEINPIDFVCYMRPNLTGAVTIKNGATTIGNSSFRGSSITSVTIPNTVTRINQQAFDGVPLTSLVIPDSVTYIDHYALRSMRQLVTIQLSRNLATLGSQVFASSHFDAIDFPGTLAIIPSQTCDGCRSMTSLTLNEGITTINVRAFYDCRALPNVTVPSTVTTMGNLVFGQCFALKEVIMLPTTPPTAGPNMFLNTHADLVIYVPDASVSAYQSASNWSAYASRIKGISERPT